MRSSNASRLLVLISLPLFTLAACRAPSSDPEPGGSVEQAVWTNGDFESDPIGTTPPTGWTVTTNLNLGITDTRPSPQTLASLNLAAGGSALTQVVGGTAETQTDPDMGTQGTLRYPKYGTRAVRVNSTGASTGAGNNANSVRQTMTVSLGDVDPLDNKVHVRFAIAPILENPGHSYTQQPYYFVRLQNLTKNQIIYQDFNASGQAGVPWKNFTDTGGQAAQYTDWQLVDVSPGNSLLAVGDQVELVVTAAGCSQGGHWGHVYVDAVGSGVPGLYTWATGPQAANAGSTITYTVNYKNGGTTTASGTAIDFVTPPNTTFQSVSLGAACTRPAVGATGTVTCPLGTLANGSTGSFQVTVGIPAATANGTVILNGNYSIYATGVSALLGPKVYTTVTSSVSYADLSVTLSDGVAAIGWGQPTTYQLDVSNAGPVAASSLTVSDVMPAQLTGVTWTCSATGGGACTASGSGSINDSAAQLPVGATLRYTISASIIAGSGSGQVINTATVTVGGGVSDPDTTNNTALDTNAIGTLRTLSLTKSGDVTGGSVTSVPASISCAAGCGSGSGQFLDGSQVVLTAAPVAGATFTGWGGACSGTASTCTVTMSGDQSVTATFLGAPASVTVTGGGSQSATVSTAFAQALQVRVTDAGGNPVPGVTVAFAAPGSGATASLSAASASTNASGLASVTATASATAGSYQVTATVSGLTPATFSLTNLGLPASIVVSSGSSQSTAVTTAFGGPLVALVRDAANQPVSGATVTFTAPGSGASASLGASSAVTDASGLAQVTATASAVAGSYAVTAQVSGVATPASFSLTNTAGAATTLTLLGATTRSATVAAGLGTFTVRISDAHDNPVPGATVSFTAPGSGATATLSAGSAVTDASGQASITATAGTVAGAFAITASSPGTTPADFSIATTSAAPASLQVVSGTPQSAVVDVAFAALVARVVDPYGNPVAGVTVSFSAPGSGATASVTASAVTDAGGQVSAAATAGPVAGNYAVTAALPAWPAVTAATYALTNTAGAPAAIDVSSGGAQSAVVTTAFAAALVARVVDVHGNPVPGATVTFTAPGSGASASLSAGSAVTGASGLAQVTATASAVAGSYAVTAQVSGVATPASFSLTNTAGAATTLTLLGATTRSATVATGLGTFTVRISDAHDNPVPGATVSFTAPGSGATATLSAGSAVTDASGQASITATAGTVAGAFAITASSPGTTPADFSIATTPAAPASLQVVSGTPQSAVVDAAFAALVARVVDAYGNPVSGVTVAFSAPGSGATASVTGSAVTGASGQVSAAAMAGTVTGSYAVTAALPAWPAVTAATYALTNTAGAATTLTLLGATTRSATVAAGLGTFTVRISDAHDNPVPGATVSFTAPGSGATATLSAGSAVTGASGQASITATAGTVAGAFAITASSPGTTPADFSIATTSSAPASLQVVSGTPQSAVVDAAFAALVARVVDAYGNPVSGVTVAFSAPGSGATASVTGSAVTGASGQVSAAATAGTVTGSYAVTAALPAWPAVTAATYALTNTAGAPVEISVVGDAEQSAEVTTEFAAPLVVQVVDVHGNPVPAATVMFAAPGSGATATLDASTRVTDSVGRAQVVATASAIAGGYLVTAQVSGVATAAEFALTNLPGAPASIAVSSGGAQSAVILTEFTSPLQVRVLDAHGNPVPGATVSFTVPAAGASATVTAAVITDADGHAETRAMANSFAGGYQVVAAVGGVATSAPFALTNTAAAAASITIVTGDPQDAVVATTFGQPLGVVVRDHAANPVPGATVIFAAPSSPPGALLSATSAVTDAAGRASITAIADHRVGSYTVSADVSAGPPVLFHLRNLPGAPARISAAAASTPQATTVLQAFVQPLAVHVEDAFGNPVPGASVSYQAPTTAATATLSAATVITGDTGDCEVLATASATTGAYVATARVAGVGVAATFALTNTAGAPATVTIAGGQAQATEVDTDFPEALEVLVLDAQDNPVPGAAVSFAAASGAVTAVLSASSVATGSDGLASVRARAGTVTGAHQATAVVVGAAAPVTFELRNTPGAPAAITASPTASPQQAQVATAYTRPLLAQVVDRFGNPVPGVAVTYAAPLGGATGALSASAAVTDDSGQVAVELTAGNLAGSFAVTATVAGLSPATFTLTNLHGAAHQITVVGGAGQQAQVASAFGAALVVRVTDAYGNPVLGETVQFGAPTSGATAELSTLSVTTDAQGLATSGATAGTVTGDYQVIATSAQGATPAAFALRNTPGAPASITTVTGSAEQSAQVLHPFTQTLAVQVRDAYGNVVPGALVDFATTAGPGAALMASPATTDGDGVAQVQAIADHVAGTYQVQATVAGVATPAVFALTNTSSAPGSVVVARGGGQSALATTGFAEPLVFQVLDAYGNPVADVEVTIALPASGPGASMTTTVVRSGAAGEVSISLVANAFIGDFEISASAPGATSSATAAMTVAAIPTEVSVSAPSELSVDQQVPLSIRVSAPVGTPAGEVRVLGPGGELVATGALVDGVVEVSVPLTARGVTRFTVLYPAQGAYSTGLSTEVVLLVQDDGGTLSGAGGCDAGAGGGGLTLVWLLLAMARVMRRGAQLQRKARVTLLALLALVGLPARAALAQSETRSINRYHAAAADSEWFSADSLTYAAAPMQVALGLTWDYARRPLVVYELDGSVRSALVEDSLVAHTGASVTLPRGVRLSTSVPMAVYQDGEPGVFNGVMLAGPTYAFGDMLLAGDVRVLGAATSALRAAVGLRLTLPTGSRTHYMSDSELGVEPRAMVAGVRGRVEVGAELSTLLRRRTELAGESHGSELRYTASAGTRLMDRRLLLGAELVGAVSLVPDTSTGAPTELGVGAHYTVAPRLVLGLGATAGLVRAVGTPDQRVFLSVSWKP